MITITFKLDPKTLSAPKVAEALRNFSDTLEKETRSNPRRESREESMRDQILSVLSVVGDTRSDISDPTHMKCSDDALKTRHSIELAEILKKEGVDM